MPGRPLPNYDAYQAKILAYAEACEIKVQYRDQPGDGAYIPTLRKIAIDKDLPESTEIATLLHELGHAMDETLLDKRVAKRLNRLYMRVYTVKLSKARLGEIIDCERRAWALGRSVAKSLRIPLGKWFEREEQDALAQYADPLA